VATETTQLREDSAELLHDDYTSRSIIIGILCTLLFHVLLVVVSPNFAFDRFSGVHTGINVAHKNPGKSFDFQLDPGLTEEAKKPFNFVETNSAAPENTPDKTNNFSNRNQQSAQEIAAKEKDLQNRPSVKGQDVIKDASAIVSGDMAPPQLPTAPVPPDAKDTKQDLTEQKARAELTPLNGFEKIEGKSEDGIASNIAKTKSPSNGAEQVQEGAPDAKDATGGLVNVNQSSHAKPKDRPRLTSASLNRSSPLSNRVTGVTNIGIIGMDAHWSEYGEYLNELIEIVQTKWYSILRESAVSPPRGSHVIVTFRINAKGETDIIKVEDSGSGKQGVFSCQNAITYPQPYRKWTEQMMAVLGDSQELTFSFYYQ
jgi:hypothetical protein